MNDIDNDYLELKYYNNTDYPQEVILENHRMLPIIDGDSDYNITIARFCLSTDLIPMFVPRIEPSFKSLFYDETGNLYDDYVETFENEHVYKQSYIDPVYRNPVFMTNLQVGFEIPKDTYNFPQFPKDRTVSTGQNYTGFTASHVKWRPENIYEIPPPNYDRKNILQSRYFHCYSREHLFNLIARELNNMIATNPCCPSLKDIYHSNQGEIELSVVDGKSCIFIPWALCQNTFFQQCRIIINDDIKNLFGFRTVPHETRKGWNILVIQYELLQPVSMGINNYKYATILEQYVSEELFPFSHIGFSSTTMKTRQMKSHNNNNLLTQNATIPTITDLLLDVSDLNNFYNSLIYVPDNYSRKIKLENAGDMSKVKLNVYLETSDGYYCPVLVRPRGKASILIQFSKIYS